MDAAGWTWRRAEPAAAAAPRTCRGGTIAELAMHLITPLGVISKCSIRITYCSNVRTFSCALIAIGPGAAPAAACLIGHAGSILLARRSIEVHVESRVTLSCMWSEVTQVTSFSCCFEV
jgi:hypothetical protein